MTDINFIDHNYANNNWIGIVVNSNDPTFSGRCQVKILGIHNDIKDEHCLWATPVNSGIFAGDGAGSLSVPKVGQFVRIQLNNGDPYAPEYTGIQNIDTELIQRIKNDYQGTHVLAYDPIENLTIIFQPNSGIQIYYKESYFQITPDTMITISTPNGDSVIQMNGDITNITTKNEVIVAAGAKAEVIADEVIVNGAQTTKIGPGPYFQAVMGEPLIALLSTMASALDAKFPATPGVNVGLVESAKQSMLSTNVVISV